MIVIVGAGPSGLKLSRELGARKVEHVVLESAAAAGSSFARMPQSLRLQSSWYMSCLDAEDRGRFPREAYISAREMADYLADYALRHRLPVHYGTEVQQLRSTEQGVLLQTTGGEFVASKVVWATGYWSAPYFSLSAEERRRATVPIYHYADDPASLHDFSDKRVLVVGSRLSAGQVLLDIHRKSQGRAELWLSHRSPIKFMPLWVRRIPSPLLLALEDLLAAIFPRTPYPVPMEDTLRPFFREGTIRRCGVIQHLAGRTVLFDGGQSMEFDALIFATGFRYRKPPGIGDSEAVILFGVDGRKNFRSRFLRGIRGEACELARQLAQTQ